MCKIIKCVLGYAFIYYIRVVLFLGKGNQRKGKGREIKEKGMEEFDKGMESAQLWR